MGIVDDRLLDPPFRLEVAPAEQSIGRRGDTRLPGNLGHAPEYELVLVGTHELAPQRRERIIERLDFDEAAIEAPIRVTSDPMNRQRSSAPSSCSIALLVYTK